MKTARAALALLVALVLPACMQPAAASKVAANNDAVVRAVAESYVGDLVAMRGVLVGTLDAQEAIVIGDTERELISAGYITPNGPDFNPFDDDLPNPEKTNALISEVRLGRLSVAEAKRWLIDYTTLKRASNTAELRRSMLLGLGPGSDFSAARNAVLAAFDEHTAAVLVALDLGKKNAAGLRSFTDTAYPLQEYASSQVEQLWTKTVDAKLADKPSARAAASDLLALVLGRKPKTP